MRGNKEFKKRGASWVKGLVVGVRNRYGNSLGSTWRRQTKTVVLHIINSSNKIKGQTNKCHTFSILLFNQLSLYMQCLRKCFDFIQIMQQFLEALAFFLTQLHTAPNFEK